MRDKVVLGTLHSSMGGEEKVKFFSGGKDITRKNGKSGCNNGMDSSSGTIFGNTTTTTGKYNNNIENKKGHLNSKSTTRKTPLHLKQTQSSSFKVRQRSVSPHPSPPAHPHCEVQLTNGGSGRSKVLQRQYAFQQNSKESLNSGDGGDGGGRSGRRVGKNGCGAYVEEIVRGRRRGNPDGCEFANAGESSKNKRVFGVGVPGSGKVEVATTTTSSTFSRRQEYTTKRSGCTTQVVKSVHKSAPFLQRTKEDNNNKALKSGHPSSFQNATPGRKKILGSEHAEISNRWKTINNFNNFNNNNNNNNNKVKIVKAGGGKEYLLNNENKKKHTIIKTDELNNNHIIIQDLETLIDLRIQNKKKNHPGPIMGSIQPGCCTSGGGSGSGGVVVKSNNKAVPMVANHDNDDHLEFVVPLEPHVEVVEGSSLELWVKVKGAKRVVWVKNEQVIRNAPPDFVTNSNEIDGIYSLRIKDVFLQDKGVYICEAYGIRDKGKDLICWCNVDVIGVEEEDDESLLDEVILREVHSPIHRRKLIVPLIITTPSSDISMDDHSNDLPASDRRSFFANSTQSSRDFYEDALEDICEVAEVDEEEENQPEVVEQEPEVKEPESEVVESVIVKEDNTCSIIKEVEDFEEDRPLSPRSSPLRSQSSTESGASEEVPCPSSTSSTEEDIKEFDMSGSSVECNSGYLGTFRDSLSDNPLSPKFLMGPSNLIVMLGETVHLRVKIWTTEDAKTDIGWCKMIRGAYKPLNSTNSTDSSSSSRIEITQPTNDLVMLTISGVTYEDCGKYRVKISNSYGADYHHCLVSVEGPPEPPPTSPTACYDPLLGQMIICWPCCPFDGGSAIIGYILEMKMKPNPNSTCDYPETWAIITSPSFKGICYTLKSPKACHTYYFRVCVENSHGKGKYSGTSDGINLPEDENRMVASSSGQSGSKILRKKISTKSSSLSEGDGSAYEYKNVVLQHADFFQYYDRHEQLGKGRFGVVMKVTCKSTNKSYAGKFVKCRKASDKERAELEYKIMNDLKFHPKLICLVDAFEMQKEIVIVTEMINGGELFERVVADDFTLTERDCVTFLRQICDGAKYIHEKNIMHLDLKPENILCTQKTSNRIKIIDFGLAQYYNASEPIRVLFGTAEFVSPEIINYETICPATDMWSVGVITYILLSGLSPFLGDDDNETFSNITRGDFDFEDEAFDKISEDAKDFISSVILKRKEERLTAEECLQHKWLALSESEKTDIVLSTDKLKRFLLRRKWQKTGNAIRALGRITTLYSSSRRSSGGTTPSTSSTGGPTTTGSGGGDAILKSGNLPSTDSVEDDSVFCTTPVVTTPTTTSGDQQTTKREDFAMTKSSRYDESCRSDSGIGGEGPVSGPYSIE